MNVRSSLPSLSELVTILPQNPTTLVSRRPAIVIFEKNEKYRCRIGSNLILENMAIANALQLEAAQAMPALSRFHDCAMPSLKSLKLSIAAS